MKWRKSRKPVEAVTTDPVELELFTHRFAAIAWQMGEMLRRTALSVNVKERLDFSCALLDPDGELVVNAPHIPVHLGALGLCVRSVRDALPLAARRCGGDQPSGLRRFPLARCHRHHSGPIRGAGRRTGRQTPVGLCGQAAPITPRSAARGPDPCRPMPGVWRRRG